MDREFIELYQRELDFLYAHAEEFAAEYPRIAQHLGGMVRERTDPMVAGLLEGAAFLAARVQLKLKDEFPEFINNLLDQLVPHYLAPSPSCMIVKVTPPYGDPGLRQGRTISRGSRLDASYVRRDRRVACEYNLSAPITLWPFEITGAEYYQSTAPMQALGIPVSRNALAGLRLSLTCRVAANLAEEPKNNKQPDGRFSGCRIRNLPIHLAGAEADADALCEQLFAHGCGIWFRYLDEFDDPKVLSAPPDCLVHLGFEEADPLIPNDKRVFGGFDLLRDYFAFPRKFLAFDIIKLDEVIDRLPAKSIDIVIAFNEVNSRLAAAVNPGMFALYAAPAVNLFKKSTDRVQIKSNQSEYHIVPDKSRTIDFEIHRVLEVFAHRSGGAEKIEVPPLYSVLGRETSGGLSYTVRRLPRRQTLEERRYGTQSNYMGTEMFIALGDNAGLEDESRIAELSVNALCSNRHLAVDLPIGLGLSDFRFKEDESLIVNCATGPSRPRKSVVSYLKSSAETANTGAVAWRLLNMLSLNHLGLVEHAGGKNAQAVREILSMFADLGDTAAEHRIRAVLSVDSTAVVRRIRQAEGIGPARGIEITVTLDDKGFEGSGPFLLGAVLERFFCEYAAFNHFTQLVLKTSERREIMRWPPRPGARRAL